MPELPQIHTLRTAQDIPRQDKPARRFKYVNVPFLLTIVLLVSYGLVVVWSAVMENPDYSFTRQLSGVAVGAVFMLVLWRFDYRHLENWMVPLIIINVVLILSPHLPIIGVEAKGAQSWIALFGVQVQPGEFAKFTVILMAASAVARYGGRIDSLKEYLKVLGILLVPFLCIMTQPDLGTGLVYLFIAAVALVVGGAKPKYLLATLALGILAIVAVFVVDQMIFDSSGEYKLLKQYQRDRLLVFLNPEYDLSGAGHNLEQAKTAIGSGGLFGKGLLQSTQSTLGFLPEAPTDFIFCVLAEELGFLGVMALLALYLALILVCFRIAGGAGDFFGTVIVMCIVGMWLFQILQNIGMTCGLMPITGIPLPFLSYGSSFMMVNFMLLGLVGSVWAHSNH